MAYRDNLEDVEAEIRTDIAAGHLDRALNRITSLGEQLFADRSVVTAVYGSYTLDTLCTEIGAVATPGATAPPQSDLVVYLATELAYPGGHTFVIRDLVRAQPDRRHVLLLSGSLGPVDASRADAFFGGAVDVEVAPPASPSETMKWLIARLGEYHPGRAFLLAHPYDAPAVAAFQPGLAREMVFYHHVDHTFTLGLNVRSVEVAAFRAAGYWNARIGLGLPSTRYLPLTAGETRDREPPGPGPVTTASSGYWQKFATPYEHRYVVHAPRWISATGGRHVHVGWLHPEMIAEISAGIAHAGVEPGRFIYVPDAPSLADALLEHGVDIYIDSFPLAGCRSVLEAMAAGIAVVTHHNESSELLSNETLVYPGAASWRAPDEALDLLEASNRTGLYDEGRWGREYYEANHSPSVVAAVLAGALADAPPPIYRPYRRSTLSMFLDREVPDARKRTYLPDQVYWSLEQIADLVYEDEADDRAGLRGRISAMLFELLDYDPLASGPGDAEQRIDFVTALSAVSPRILTASGVLNQRNASQMLYDLATTGGVQPETSVLSAVARRVRRGIRRSS